MGKTKNLIFILFRTKVILNQLISCVVANFGQLYDNEIVLVHNVWDVFFHLKMF